MSIHRLALIALLAAVVICTAPRTLRADDNSAPATQPAASPAAPDTLKALLPDKLGGLDRNNATGQKMAAASVSFSSAEGDYGPKDGDKPPSIKLTILDYVGMPGMADGIAVWSKVSIDQEGDSGYQKSTKVGNYAAMQQWDKSSQHGQLQVLVADRFIVSVETTNLAQDQFEKLGADLPLDKVAGVK